MKFKIFTLVLFLACNDVFATQTNVVELVKNDKMILTQFDNNIKVNTVSVQSSPSWIKTVAGSHNTQKQLDTAHQERIIEMTLETRRTEQRADGTVIVTETKPSTATLEAVTQNKQNYMILKDATGNLSNALLLFKAIGGL